MPKLLRPNKLFFLEIKKANLLLFEDNVDSLLVHLPDKI